MTYLHESNLSVTLSSSNAGAANIGASSAGYGIGTASTHITGYIESIYIKIPGGCGAGCNVLVTSSSTSKVILRITDPSSGGETYYPRQYAQASTLTATPLGSTIAMYSAVPISMKDERMKAVVHTSSLLMGARKTATLRAIWK